MAASVTTRQSYMMGTTPPTLSQNVRLNPKDFNNPGQPQIPLNTNGDSFAINFGAPPPTLTQRNGSHLASVQITRFGKAMSPGGGAPNASGFRNFNSRLIIARPNRTIFWHGYITQNASAGIDSLFGRYYDSIATYDGAIKLHITSAGFAKVTYQVGSTSKTLTGTTPITANTKKTIFVTISNDTVSLYIDGKLDTSVADTLSGGDNANLNTMGFIGADPFTFNGHEYQRALLVGALGWCATPSEALDFHNNPWKLFQTPNKQVWVPA